MNIITKTHYAKKYEGYARANTVKGWAKHIYLVLLSLMINP